ncbi:MAG: hypothetical protein H5T83_11330 [Actinotalea sp.]|nr:hypothetical protein [Actinotalea sp.]
MDIPTSRLRHAAAWTLALLLLLLVPVTAVAVWVRALVLDTEAFVGTVGPVIEEPAVRTALADAAADRAAAAVQLRLSTELPPELRPLAPALAGQVEPVVQRQAIRVLQAPVTARVWERAVTLAHGGLVRVLEGDGRISSVVEDGVVVDVSGVAGELAAALDARGIRVQERVAEVTAGDGELRIVLVDGDTLAQVRGAAALLDTMAGVLPWVSVAVAVAAAALLPQRAPALLLVGVGGGPAVLLLLLALGHGVYLDRLPDDATTRAAGAALAELLLQDLRTTGRILLATATLAAAGAWLVVGRHPRARAVRSAARALWQHASPWSATAGGALLVGAAGGLLLVDVLSPAVAALLVLVTAAGITFVALGRGARGRTTLDE